MELLKRIESLRDEMVKQGMTLGFSDDRTVETSKELDELINIAQEKRIYV